MKSFLIFTSTLVLLQWAGLSFVYGQLDPSSSSLLEGEVGEAPTSSGRYRRRQEVRTGEGEVTIKVIKASEVKKASNVEESSNSEIQEQIQSVSSSEKSSLKKSETGNYLKLKDFSFQISPALFYQDSSSWYFFRRYFFFSQGFDLSVEMKVRDNLSIWGRYFSSLGADIYSQDENRVDITYQRIEGGIDFVRRNFNGEGSNLSYGLYFLENRLRMPDDEEKRVGLRTLGLGAQLQVEIPQRKNKILKLGLQFAPSLDHSEKATSYLNLKSGTSVKTTEMSFNWGYRYKLSEKDSLFWNLKISSEKNNFVGVANQADPVKQKTPKNVSVTQTSTLFSIGYRWGY